MFDWPPTGALISGPIGLGRFGRRAQLGRRSTLKQVAQASEPCALPSNPICRINRRARCAHLTHCALMDNSLKGPPLKLLIWLPLPFHFHFRLMDSGQTVCLAARRLAVGAGAAAAGAVHRARRPAANACVQIQLRAIRAAR